MFFTAIFANVLKFRCEAGENIAGRESLVEVYTTMPTEYVVQSTMNLKN